MHMVPLITQTHTHTFPSLSVPMDSLLFVCTNDEEKGEEIPQRERQDPKNVLFVTFFSLLYYGFSLSIIY